MELRHAPAWQLAVPHRTAEVVIRATAWWVRERLRRVSMPWFPVLSKEDLSELSAVQSVMPGWMAESLSRRLAHR